jgi:hypothetical protein
MILVNINIASEFLALDSKSTEVLKMFARGSDWIKLPDFIHLLKIMNYYDWNHLEEVICDIAEKIDCNFA